MYKSKVEQLKSQTQEASLKYYVMLWDFIGFYRVFKI
jgi:hypothetical protein